MKLSKTKLAILALITANIIWGAAPPIFKWSLQGTPLYTLAFLRFLIPALLIALFARKSLAIKRKDFRKMFYIGYCNITLNIVLLFLGLQLAPSINASIIASAGPIFLIFGSLLFLNEKTKLRVWIGNSIGFLGILIIIFQPLLEHYHMGSILGNLLLVGSTLAVVEGTILAKELSKEYSATIITFWSFVVGTITCLPLFIMEVCRIGFLPHISIQSVIGIIFGVFLSSLAAYFLYYWGLARIAASETGVFSYIDPIVTFLIAIPLLHEFPTPTFSIGAFLVFAGIYIAEKRINYHPIQKLLQKETGTLTLSPFVDVLKKVQLPKEVTTVTLLSKTMAMILFITLPIIGFFLGIQYQEALTDANTASIIIYMQNPKPPSPTRTLNQQCKIDSDCILFDAQRDPTQPCSISCTNYMNTTVIGVNKVWLQKKQNNQQCRIGFMCTMPVAKNQNLYTAKCIHSLCQKATL